MPKITGQMVKPESAVNWIGEEYRINDVQQGTFGTGKQAGYRVKLVNDDGEVNSVMLWDTEEFTETSKLGSFVAALGDDTDTWIGCNIVFLSWTPRSRKIKVVQRPRRAKMEEPEIPEEPEPAAAGVGRGRRSKAVENEPEQTPANP